MVFSRFRSNWILISALALLLIVPAMFSVASAPDDFARIAPGYRSIKTMGELEYIEVNTPAEDGSPKQLIVFVHGTPGSFSAFLHYVDDPVMREHFHMISVTRPGWIDSSATKIPSLNEQAKALEPIIKMDLLGKGAILMGHSYGGPVIARTAMDYPELVAGLIFVATTADPEFSGPRWQDLVTPVLIVQGDRDRLVNPRNADFLNQMLVNADVTYLKREGQGHFVLWEEAELIRDTLIEKFL